MKRIIDGANIDGTNFVFRNSETGELRRGVSFSLNSAARQAGLNVEYRGKLPKPWMAWECWKSPSVCVWHYTADGEIHKGSRQ